MISLKFPMRLISKDNDRSFNRAGRPYVPTKFTKFEKDCILLAKSQYKGEPLSGNLKMIIVVCYKDKRHGDASNLGKSICDALGKGLIYGDDRQIKNFHVCVAEGMAADKFEVDIEVIE